MRRLRPRVRLIWKFKTREIRCRHQNYHTYFTVCGIASLPYSMISPSRSTCDGVHSDTRRGVNRRRYTCICVRCWIPQCRRAACLQIRHFACNNGNVCLRVTGAVCLAERIFGRGDGSRGGEPKWRRLERERPTFHFRYDSCLLRPLFPSLSFVFSLSVSFCEHVLTYWCRRTSDRHCGQSCILGRRYVNSCLTL